MKKLFITLMIAFVAISSFATEYETVYSCGFEDVETDAISKWDLKNAAEYATLSQSYKPTDLFYIGNANHSAGNNSLYVSNDSVKTDTLRFYKSQATSYIVLNSTADLSISMAPGNYVLDFDYYLSSPQSLYVYILNDRFTENDSLNISDEITTKQGEWKHSQYSFIIPEGKQGKWLCFGYSYSTGRIDTDTLLVKSLSIDNVSLKKENTSSSVSLVKSENIVVAVSNDVVRIAGTRESATIYNLGGAKVYEGTDRDISLPRGVYIVRIGTVAKKVIVK